MYAKRARSNYQGPGGARVTSVATPLPGRRELSLSRGIDGQLWAQRDGESRAVWVCRSFPWSEPTRCIALRDEDEKEFARVRDLSDLDVRQSLRLGEMGLPSSFSRIGTGRTPPRPSCFASFWTWLRRADC